MHFSSKSWSLAIAIGLFQTCPSEYYLDFLTFVSGNDTDVVRATKCTVRFVNFLVFALIEMVPPIA